MRFHLVDAHGHLHMRPFVYSLRLREGSFDQYEEDPAQPHPVKLFLRGARYRLLGFLPCRMHFFGAESARIYLLGSDAYGRDQFSRFLVGGQVSLAAGLLGAGLTLLIGLCVGAMAGYYGGLRENRLVHPAPLLLPFPWFFLLFALSPVPPPRVPPSGARF